MQKDPFQAQDRACPTERQSATAIHFGGNCDGGSQRRLNDDDWRLIGTHAYDQRAWQPLTAD